MKDFEFERPRSRKGQHAEIIGSIVGGLAAGVGSSLLGGSKSKKISNRDTGEAVGKIDKYGNLAANQLKPYAGTGNSALGAYANRLGLVGLGGAAQSPLSFDAWREQNQHLLGQPQGPEPNRDDFLNRSYSAGGGDPGSPGYAKYQSDLGKYQSALDQWKNSKGPDLASEYQKYTQDFSLNNVPGLQGGQGTGPTGGPGIYDDFTYSGQQPNYLAQGNLPNYSATQAPGEFNSGAPL